MSEIRLLSVTPNFRMWRIRGEPQKGQVEPHPTPETKATSNPGPRLALGGREQTLFITSVHLTFKVLTCPTLIKTKI